MRFKRENLYGKLLNY